MKILYISARSLLFSNNYLKSIGVKEKYQTSAQLQAEVPFDREGAEELSKAATSCNFLIFPIDSSPIYQFLIEKRVFRSEVIAPKIQNHIRLDDCSPERRLLAHVYLMNPDNWQVCGNIDIYLSNEIRQRYIRSEIGMGVTRELLIEIYNRLG
jgi:hypothetical protein